MPYAKSQNKNVDSLVDLIDSDYEITLVPVRIDSKSKYRNCYQNVQSKIEKNGGRIQCGWTITENELMCEAVHHAVWENEKGELIDITPKSEIIAHILFIPDDRLIYDDRIIDNIRINVSGNPVVDDLICVAEFQSIIIESGNRKSDSRVSFDGISKDLYLKYIDIGTIITQHAIYKMGLYESCSCGSNKPYSECHGDGLKEMIIADKKLIPNNVVTLFGNN